VGEIGTKGRHMVGPPAVHVDGWPLPLAEPPLYPQIPYLRSSNDTCAKGLTRSV
jgi:hypothetical protein